MTIRLYDQHSTSFDFNPGASLPFADIAELAAFDDRQISDGGLAYTTSVRSLWIKRVVSPVPTTDGITIVATASGDGAWYRSTAPSLSWQSQATWYIDPAAGDDENDGSTTAAGGSPTYVGALATWAEYMRRTDGVVSTNTTVTVLGAMAEDIVGVLRGAAANLEFLLVGTPTVLASGTVAAVSLPVPATNTRGVLSVTGIATFVGLEGKIVETVGTRTLWAVVLRDDAGSASTPYWAEAATTASPNVSQTPLVNDAVRVIDLCGVPTVQLDAHSVTLRLRYFKFTNALTNRRATQLTCEPSVFAFYEACDVGITTLGRATYFVGCSIGAGGTVVLTGPGSAFIVGGGGRRSFSISNGTNASFQGTCFQGMSLTVQGLGTALNVLNTTAPMGVWDSPAATNGILVSDFAQAWIVAVFGSGNTLAGLAVRRGAAVNISAGYTPTLTGSGDIDINGTVAPSLPTQLVAGAAVPAAQVVNWANWNNAAIFNRQLLAFSNGTRIIG